jgi:polysaccharide export outer membrane protein
VSTIDLYNYLVRGGASQDIRVESGDVVFVGVQGGRVSIKGQIVRPAIYELLPGETLADLISTAGGFTTEALQQRVQVRRVLPADQRQAGGRDRVVLDVPPSQFAAGTASGFLLVPGDRVEVFPINGVERNAIVVAGNVWTAGTQGYRAGMTLSQAIQAAGGVRPDVYLDQVLVSRLEPDGVRQSLHTSFADSLGTLTQDLSLQEGDSVYIYSRTDFSPKRYVAITGAVMHGGQYDYRRGMTLRELMLLAGGPLESADLREAEIARFPSNRPAGVLAQTFRVPLDSSYVFEKSPYANYLGRPGVALPGKRAPEVELQPYDNVLIFRQPLWHMLGEVALTGEVRYPGSYTLTKTGERLSELVARAGGLTTNADPEGLVFYRKADSAGRIGVDLPEVLRNSRSPENIALVPGDSIAIGAHKPYVRVAGAVNSPIAVAYVRGAALDYYISAAGGPTQLADIGRAYVRQPNGGVESRVHRWLLPDRDVFPKAGATVVVPAKDPTQKADVAAIAAALTPIIVATLSAIALIVHH